MNSLRLIPSVDSLMLTETARGIAASAGVNRLTAMARAAIESLRQEMLSGGGKVEWTRETLLAEAERRLAESWKDDRKMGSRRVINATGVVIHTNLGRAPLSEKAKEAIRRDASGYCTLEYDIGTGKRGKRGTRAEQLLAELTGAEAALTVNNCAAACFLVLTVLARGGEVIISRGEMVEIGGDFRVPDVMEQSGAALVEVGTTNRTRVADYEAAISDNTRLILRVHPSNYRIVGFTSTPDLAELAEIAHSRNLILYEDAGSGALQDLSDFGLTDEPVITRSIAAGADVVTFSGDKLLGSVQAGIIVGRKDLIERLRKHPLYRALRGSKLTYAALEATLESFRRGKALEEIPVLKMLSMSEEEIKERAVRLIEKLRARKGDNVRLTFEIIKGNSVIGGGAAPSVQPATALIALRSEKLSAAALDEYLRSSAPPLIARILEDRVVIDLRTVSVEEEDELIGVLIQLPEPRPSATGPQG
jgi:L-seryl-tRNA(Ser) seleniumtransferase